MGPTPAVPNISAFPSFFRVRRTFGTCWRIGQERFIQRVFARVFNLFSSGRRIYRLSAFRLWGGRRGAAAWAALKRQSGGIDGSLITAKKKSTGNRPGLEAVAANAALTSAVFLLGVPGWRPPRLSPTFDPLGIAFLPLLFATSLLI